VAPEAATEVAISTDRRRRRRQESIEEVLDIAVEIMAEQGVAGLSVGEISRRMGIRPPSLYVYFPSKSALYDALFARGARLLLETMQTLDTLALAQERGLEGALLASAERFVGWSMTNPAYSQLLFWRPVPGFAPSQAAYESAVHLVELSRERFANLQDLGYLRQDVPAEDLHRDWTVLVSGVVSQQLSNAPEETFAGGRFSTALPGLVAMFTRYYSTTEDQRRGGVNSDDKRTAR
jgi:AcrR family transcriptional regulator